VLGVCVALRRATDAKPKSVIASSSDHRTFHRQAQAEEYALIDGDDIDILVQQRVAEDDTADTT
jgi:hypothetical protein